MPHLFAYGTLQQADVQVATFGRLLSGQPDELVGFERVSVTLADPRFASTRGEPVYPIVKFNGRSDSRVTGTLYELSESELARADAYEPPPYIRILVTLASGTRAWVYADGRET